MFETVGSVRNDLVSVSLQSRIRVVKQLRGGRSKEAHSVLKFKQWLSFLTRSGRNIEHAIDWVMYWEKRVKEEQPSAYTLLQEKERRVLTRAGRFMLKKYTQDLEERKLRQGLGTRARQETLERFIYHFARYLIPVLERSSVSLYRDAVEYALNNVVLEYSAYVGDPLFFFELQAKNTHEILISAKSLGLGVPFELFQKCEAALAPKSLTVQEFVAGFRVDWDNELVDALENIFGKRPFADASLYDALMMTISKLPELRLSRYLESHGVNKAELNVGAAKLLAIANSSKGILQHAGEPQPLFFLLKWYFSAVRNRPHHEFASYKSSEVRDAVLVTNYVLNQINTYADERLLSR